MEGILFVQRDVNPEAIEENKINVNVEKANDKSARKVLHKIKKKIQNKIKQKNRIDYLQVDPLLLPKNLPKTKKIKNKKIKNKLNKDVRLAIISSKKMLANSKFKRVDEGFIRFTHDQTDNSTSKEHSIVNTQKEWHTKGKRNEFVSCINEESIQEEEGTSNNLAEHIEVHSKMKKFPTQKEIYNKADVGTKKKILNLRLNLGPYKCSYSRNGKYLLSTGEKGHITLIDTHNLEPKCELEVEETVRCSTILHNHKLFAVAQKKYIYIYDNTGIEVNCIKDILYTYQMEFLPFHFLLTSVGEFGELVYQDISIGNIVTRKKTKRGPCTIMKQNKHDATIYLGHKNGHVTIWTPNMDKPVCDMFCHETPISSLSIQDNYLITASLDCTYKLWDMRKLEFINSYRSHNIIDNIEISDRNIVAFSMNSHFRTYKNFFSKPELYLTHNICGDKINSISFQPFEDICCVGSKYSIKSLLIPGAGLANIDTFVNNPYETKKQVRENEIRSLLEKLPPDTIHFKKNEIGKVNPYTFPSNPKVNHLPPNRSYQSNLHQSMQNSMSSNSKKKNPLSTVKNLHVMRKVSSEPENTSNDEQSTATMDKCNSKHNQGKVHTHLDGGQSTSWKQKKRNKKNQKKKKKNSFLNSNVPKYLRKSFKD
ncbi:hypothetical protein, conserved [Plasmodium gonderi]|uniref:BING4 C-terminal domain-containing protein n=1 Tax=Plasmodium gonderi TaxID=77519 RepID=A0A1Y1JDG6_PLAGO|nr:hypothetical protein, conserved [Plasmodium gonderi]GAW79365.1 hypothetical protein, conserved [Plasmodium gonderi]